MTSGNRCTVCGHVCGKRLFAQMVGYRAFFCSVAHKRQWKNGLTWTQKWYRTEIVTEIVK